MEPREHPIRTRRAALAIGTLAAIVAAARAADPPSWDELAPPTVEGRWVRPAATTRPARPVWGHADGLRVGVYPSPGPRGLLRVYAPYLGHEDQRVINFVAIEPIPAGQSGRGLSELENSKLDGVRGKRMWSVEDPRVAVPRLPWEPARGEITTVGGVETLCVWVWVEPFDNGAKVYLRLTFRADRPHEVGIATFPADGSAPLDYCVVTATMGNYARLRDLHLAGGRVAHAADLWPDFAGDGFAPHAKFKLADLTRTPAGDAVTSATPNEARPQDAAYAPGTRAHWHYAGQVATQSWRCESPDPRLEVWVNGRTTYWASRSPIPGGIAFENFEMVAPFHPGLEFWFGAEPGMAVAAAVKAAPPTPSK